MTPKELNEWAAGLIGYKYEYYDGEPFYDFYPSHDYNHLFMVLRAADRRMSITTYQALARKVEEGNDMWDYLIDTPPAQIMQDLYDALKEAE